MAEDSGSPTLAHAPSIWGLVIIPIAGSGPTVSDSVGRGQGSRTCMSDMFPGDGYLCAVSAESENAHSMENLNVQVKH